MFSKKGRHNTKEYRSLPPEALLLGASCDPLMLGEVLVLCFLFLFLTPPAGFAPRGLVLLRTPELMGVGVALPVCTYQPWPSLTHSSLTHSLRHHLVCLFRHAFTWSHSQPARHLLMQSLRKAGAISRKHCLTDVDQDSCRWNT